MKKLLQRFALATVLLLANSAVLSAQTHDKSLQQMNFVYIAHDVTTPVQHLVSRLRDIYVDAFKYENAAIFYLANETSPIIVRVNMKGDNHEDFDNVLVPELQEKNSHDIMATIDVDNILNLLKEDDIVDDNKQLLYNSATFDFYINQNFWTLQNNESVIATLYFVLDVQGLIAKDNEFFFNVYRYKDEPIEFVDGKAFGEKNVDNINEQISVLPY